MPHTRGLSLVRLGQIIEKSINEVYVFDADTLKFIFVNEGARDNLGYSLDELSELTPIDIKPMFSKSEFEALITPLRSGETEVLVFETVHKRKDGTTYPIEVHLQLSTEEEPYVFVAIILDITVHNKRSAELKEAKLLAEKASQTKSNFLAVMSHELRTPLNAILGFSQIIENHMMGPPGSGKYREYARLINESGEHLLDLVNNVLDLSAIEAGKLKVSKEETDFERLFSDCLIFVQQHAREKSIRISSNIPSPLPPLQADQRMLRQMLINLLSNAVKHTQENGNIVLSAGSPSGSVQLAVEDDGPGIPEDMIRLVLEPFEQVTSTPYNKDRSWGLGLSIVKGLAELHDGYLSVESDLGKGTRVTLTLPAA